MRNIKMDFLKYTSLNIVAMLGVSLYILADTYFIAKALGATGLAALNFAIVIFMIMQGIGMMTGIGGAIDFGIRKSESDGTDNESFMNAVLVGIVLSALFLLAGTVFSEQISYFLGADEMTIRPTMTYMATTCAFAPFFIFNSILLAFVRNDDNPSLPMAAMIISSFSNIILDYIFMFPLSMGIFGAAFATGLSPVISILVLTVHFRGKAAGFGFSRFSPDIRRMKRIMFLGMPSLVNELASSITLFTFNIVILKISGNVGVAAYGIIANAAIIATSLFSGLAQGMQPLVSECFGQYDADGLKRLLRYGLMSSISIAVAVYSAVFFFSGEIVSVFNSQGNESLYMIAEYGIKIYFTGFVFAGINIVMASFFGSISYTAEAMMISVLRSCVILIPAVLILSSAFQMTGVWISFIATEFIVTVFAYYKSGGMNNEKIYYRERILGSFSESEDRRDCV